MDGFLDYTGMQGRMKFEQEWKQELNSKINSAASGGSISSNSNDYSSFGIAANTPGLDLGGAMFIQNQKNKNSL